MLVPCRASSPRTLNCRTGCRTIPPAPHVVLAGRMLSAGILLHIQLVLRTDSRLLSEQAFKRCKATTSLSPSRIPQPLGNCIRRKIGWAWQPEGTVARGLSDAPCHATPSRCSRWPGSARTTFTSQPPCPRVLLPSCTCCTFCLQHACLQHLQQRPSVRKTHRAAPVSA